MNTIEEDYVVKVLYATTGHHGYWLVNNVDVIREDIEQLIKVKGWRKVVVLLEEDYRQSKLIKQLYRKISNA